jgi:ribonuclease R
VSPIQAVTIDPPGAKDLDDAIWVEPVHDGWLVTTCIANVAEQVSLRSTIESAARARLATHYYRDGNRPMLPRVFAEERASLLPGKPRPVVVMQAFVGRDGVVGSPRVTVGEFVSVGQLSYEEVPSVLRTEGDHTQMLMAAERCASVLLARRRSKGALAIYDTKHGWATTEDGALRKVGYRAVVGYHIVHEMMLLTNKLFSEFAYTHQIPILYRNYESRADRSSILLMLSEMLDQPEVAIDEYRRSISGQLQRAEYGATSRGHFALNVGHYCHATSPIRRYADLVTQRQIVAHVRGQHLPYSQADLQTLAEEINTTMRAREVSLSEEMKDRANRRAIRMIESTDNPLTPTDLERVVKVLVRTGGDLPAQVRPLLEQPLPIVLMAYVLFGSDRSAAGWAEVRKALLDRLDGPTAVSVLTTATQHAELKVGPMVVRPARSGGDRPTFTTMLSITHGDRLLTAVGRASTAKGAHQAAAIDLAHLVAGFEPPLPVLPDTPQNVPAVPKASAPTMVGKDPISALNELAQSAGKPTPVFGYTQEGTANKPLFRCACSYDGKTTVDTGHNKQASKRGASALMLALCTES